MTIDQLPEVAQATTIANEAHEIALAYEIDSPEMFSAAGTELQSITKRSKQIEELRLSLTRPIDESKRRIMDLFRVPLERLGQAEALLRKGMLTFQQAERERQEAARREAEAKAAAERAEQERVRREAEEAQRKAREEAEAARKAGDAAAAQAAEEAAEAAAATAEQANNEIELAEVAPVALPAVAAPKAAGISTRQTWKAEVVDLHALITAAAEGLAKGDPTMAAYLTPDTKALGQVAKALKNKARIPGVRIFAEEGLAVRAA